ncbi:MAG TPA: riboflavin synthase [Thermoanaerobaculia bacterium]|nr:riboflavin synthase [Thermoanaerobaculia bacterium]
MFTGLIQTIALVRTFDRIGTGARLSLDASAFSSLIRGESIAVNGVCLTFIPLGDLVHADLSPETLARSALGDLSPGSAVNIERALSVGDRLGGHIVQGHVDSVGELTSIREEGDFAVYRWHYGSEGAGLLVDKGSIAVDGVSLTVVDPSNDEFSAALIPETLANTNLGAARIGDRVNLEFDIIAKYTRSLLGPYLPQARLRR